MPFVSLLVVDVDIDVDIDICVDICEECGVSKEFEAVEDDSDPSMPRNHVEQPLAQAPRSQDMLRPLQR